MAEQIMSKVITKAVAEATRIVIQTMAEMQAQRVPNAAGHNLGAPALKQPTFDWEAQGKYTEWKAFILEVRNVLSKYNTRSRQNSYGEKLVWEKRAPLLRNINGEQKRSMQHVTRVVWYTGYQI